LPTVDLQNWFLQTGRWQGTIPARWPPLWDDCDAQTGDGVQIEPDWDWRHNRHPTMKLTGVSIGDWAIQRLAGLGGLPKPQVHTYAAGYACV